jgi:hypothetical protein
MSFEQILKQERENHLRGVCSSPCFDSAKALNTNEGFLERARRVIMMSDGVLDKKD